MIKESLAQTDNKLKVFTKSIPFYFNLNSTIMAIMAVIAILAIATKAWDAYAGAKEKAAKEKIKEYDGIFLV